MIQQNNLCKVKTIDWLVIDSQILTYSSFTFLSNIIRKKDTKSLDIFGNTFIHTTNESDLFWYE